jgi:hypothetical protein
MRTILYILMIITTMWFISCSARQAEKKRNEERSKMELTDQSKIDKSENQESNVKKSEVKTENKQEQTTTVKKTVEPIDPTKPASYVDENGNKKELNNSKETTETTTENKKTDTKVKTDSEENTKNAKKESEAKDIKAKEDTAKKAEEIHVKRDAWSLWNLAWLLVPVVIYLGWKNRLKIFNNKV